jgi:hypothetical protein
MSGNPEECRAQARNSLQIAEIAAHPKVTRTFVDLAHSWRRLALELETAQGLLDAIDDREMTDRNGKGHDANFHTPRLK